MKKFLLICVCWVVGIGVVLYAQSTETVAPVENEPKWQAEEVTGPVVTEYPDGKITVSWEFSKSRHLSLSRFVPADKLPIYEAINKAVPDNKSLIIFNPGAETCVIVSPYFEGGPGLVRAFPGSMTPAQIATQIAKCPVVNFPIFPKDKKKESLGVFLRRTVRLVRFEQLLLRSIGEYRT